MSQETPPANARDDAPHAQSARQVLEALDVDAERGLDEQTVRERRERHGPNELPGGETAGLPRIVLRQFADPLVYVLLVAAALSAAIGQTADALFIGAVLAVNTVLGAVQEYRAERTAASLDQALSPTARVRREGSTRELDARELVPGDIVEIGSGDAVPADLKLVESTELASDESVLTGEAVAAAKSAEAEDDADASPGDRATVLHAGCSVVAGRGVGVVVRIGADTEIGRIASALARGGEAPPIVRRMRAFTRVIAIAILAFVVVLAGIQALRGAGLVDLFLLAVALAVSAIPAGLPVAITVALSIASARMAEVAVVVRNLPAVEGLGACTMIACDKTGTLTENRLRLARLEPQDGAGIEVDGDDGAFRRDDATVDGDDEVLRALLETAVLCNEAERADDPDDGDEEPRAGDDPRGDSDREYSGDPLDVALLEAGDRAGVERDALVEARARVGRIPFESERRFAAAFHEEDGDVVAHVKGAAATVARLCGLGDDALREREEALAGEGLRVIALARGRIERADAEAEDPDRLGELEFLGLVALEDPIRDAVVDAVARCREAGVEVCMVTGDHPATGLAIARRIGFADEDAEVVTGDELGHDDETPSEEELARIRRARVFARVEPLQKTRVVELLQQAGHHVAVTGDGVNDAPALRRANVGVAMGRAGTDVARDAADLILGNDDFASIVDGIERGRVAYDNVRKVVWLLASTAVAELVLFTLSVAMDTPLPLTAVQLLWLNLVTNGVQDVALAFERGEPGVLSRPPRPRSEPVLDRLMIEQVLLSGLYMGLVAFAVFMVLRGAGMDIDAVRNLLVLLLVLFENVHLFNVRSETRSAFRIPLADNRLLVGSVLLAQGLHIGSMFVPGWRDVLGLAPVSPTTWAILLAITLTKFAVVEFYKHLRARRIGPDAAR